MTRLAVVVLWLRVVLRLGAAASLGLSSKFADFDDECRKTQQVGRVCQNNVFLFCVDVAYNQRQHGITRRFYQMVLYNAHPKCALIHSKTFPVYFWGRLFA